MIAGTQGAQRAERTGAYREQFATLLLPNCLARFGTTQHRNYGSTRKLADFGDCLQRRSIERNGNYPIKKWAALAALLMAAFYLLLSGAEVATQRSFIMIGIVLIGVMIDRAVLTFRTLTIAALGVLLLAPESVVHPSFQMSFAATLALIAGYQFSVAWASSGREAPLAMRFALWGGKELVGLTVVSLLAGTATIPYVAYHFHRASPYGVLANLAAMPVVSGWVMPWGILGVLCMPLGLDLPCWQFMGWGIDWMTAVAIWTGSLPGSLWRVISFGGGPLLICTLGIVILCLLRTPLRLIGALLIAGAVLVSLDTPQPDMMIAADLQSVAVRGQDGKLAIVRTAGSDTFAAANGSPLMRTPGRPRTRRSPEESFAMMWAALPG
jgi:competence protein ComEC